MMCLLLFAVMTVAMIVTRYALLLFDAVASLAPTPPPALIVSFSRLSSDVSFMDQYLEERRPAH